MDDKELVEVWRKEFIDLSKLGSVAAIYEMDRFLNREVELRWKGFLLAKRSLQSVVLPDIDDYWDGLERDYDTGKYEKDLHARLTAAGIKYTIEE